MVSDSLFELPQEFCPPKHQHGLRQDSCLLFSQLESDMRNTHLKILVGFIHLYVAMCRGFEVKRLHSGPSVVAEQMTAPSPMRSQLCPSVPARILRQVLGSAYNEFYMSYEAPQSSFVPDRGPLDEREAQYKRSDGSNERSASRGSSPFYVDKDYAQVLSEEPAWRVQAGKGPSTSDRPQREAPTAPFYGRDDWHSADAHSSIPDSVLDVLMSLDNDQFKWHCDAPLIWRDLGEDYFPRYVLSADCSHSSCQGLRFRCQARSFGIKVLRRRKGVCAPDYTVHEDTLEIGEELLPRSLRELWVWEIRAVSFCCVCSLL